MPRHSLQSAVTSYRHSHLSLYISLRSLTNWCCSMCGTQGRQASRTPSLEEAHARGTRAGTPSASSSVSSSVFSSAFSSVLHQLLPQSFISCSQLKVYMAGTEIGIVSPAGRQVPTQSSSSLSVCISPYARQSFTQSAVSKSANFAFALSC